MKYTKNILIGMIVILFVIFNFSVWDTTVNSISGLKFRELKIQFAHAIELPEVTITCSSEFGMCWFEDCHWEWTPLGPIRATYCPYFTGSILDSCVPGMPCY